MKEKSFKQRLKIKYYSENPTTIKIFIHYGRQRVVEDVKEKDNKKTDVKRKRGFDRFYSILYKFTSTVLCVSH